MALISARAFSYASTIPVIFSSTSFVDTKRNKLYVWQNAKIINFCERNNPFFDALLHANIVEKIAKRVITYIYFDATSTKIRIRK